MIKPTHITYLKLADSILLNLDVPYKSYTLTYEELFKRVNQDVTFDKIYSNQYDRFLTEGFDTAIEVNSKSVLFNSVLLFLQNEGYIISSTSNIQITYKGILKCLKGFEDDYNETKAKAEQAKNQQKFENFMRVLPVIVAIIFGILGYKFGKN